MTRLRQIGDIFSWMLRNNHCQAQVDYAINRNYQRI